MTSDLLTGLFAMPRRASRPFFCYVTADFSLNHATHQGALPGGCDSEPICCG